MKVEQSLKSSLFFWLALLMLLDPFVNQAKAVTDFIQDHPKLGNYVFSESVSPVHLGFGFSPLAIVRGTVVTSATLFEVHYIEGWLDWEILSASYGVTISDPNNYGMHSFTFKTIPKLRIFSNVSVGPIFGLEYVSFANIASQLTRNNFFTPVDQFSTHGWVYGVAVSETFRLSENYQLKANQYFYKETYKTSGAITGWSYYFPNNPGLNTDTTSIAPSNVFMIEFSLLY